MSPTGTVDNAGPTGAAPGGSRRGGDSLSPPLAARPRPWLEGEWERVDWMRNRSTIVLVVPGQRRATWLCWTPAWELLGWYVNLEEPFRSMAP